MTDIVESLVWHATDWNGSQLADGEPAKGDPKAGLLRDCAYEIKRLRKALKPFKKFADEYVSEGFHDTEPMEEAGGAFVWKNFQDVIKALEGK